MTDRESIFSALRGAVAETSPEARTPLPDWDPDVCTAKSRLPNPGLWENFAENLSAVNGRPMRTVEELAGFLEKNGYATGFCDPELMESVGAPLAAAGLDVRNTFERSNIDTYQFGVTRATGAIAESGTIVIDDHQTCNRLAALAPWVHIAVLHPDRVFETLHDAITAFGDCPNIIWITGPSKTADVEGILIEGVHGPGEQICLLME